MALVLADRIKETTTTTGTGTYTLAGAVTGFESFGSVGNGNTTYYCCTDGSDFEVGVGTYTSSGTTLARTTILQSSNSDNAVDWSAGTRDIFCTQPAEKAVFLDGSGDVSIPGQIKLSKTSGNAIVTTGSLSSADLGILRASAGTGGSDTHGFTIKYMGSRSGNNNSFALFMDNQTGTDVEAITVLQDGKVGINNTAPTAPLDVTGNIVVSGTVDGRDVATDGTKLDGIEASADVTDTTNVTAAGALMDSEVTNLAQVKAFDSSDYATAAQGTTADAALPKAGGTMTGNLELNNVDIVFEGSTADANETTLTAINPTADRTISLPNQSGTVMVTIGDSFRTGVSQTYSGTGSPSYLVDGEFQPIATVTPSGSSHNYFFTGRIVAQSGQNVHTLNITVALRSNTLPDLSFTANYNEDVVGTVSQYITPVLYTKETSPASFILAVEVHNQIFGTLTADLDFFARTQADLADISVNTTDGSEITSTPSGYTLNQFTKTTALDNDDQFVFNQDVQFTGSNYNIVFDKSDDALEFADNAKAKFGAGNDLQIYHDGTHSYIAELGTGGLRFASDNQFDFRSGALDETFAVFNNDGAVELYHNNSKKLETASGGISVTGEVAATSLDISGDVDVDGTLEADAITVNGTALAASATTDTTNASNIGSGTLPNARLDAQLQDVAGLAVTNGNFIVGDGSNFVAESGATARTSLGLGTAAVAATGISNGNVPVFTSGVADDDFLRVNGTSIEGRSASEVASDIGAATTDDATALAIALG
tara:strand:- start:3737 stop:6043 length:2307 start_codon:yes stop_codon:yes gene_type:complete